MAENQHVFPRKFKFFRVLLLGFSNQLAIPQRLTKYFIKEKLRLVTLLSPLGKTWNVEIGGDNEGLHFTEGWERFSAAHRLSFGDLLVFKYVGGSVFHVTIFDKSTCEKDYRITNGIAGVDHVPGQGENCDQESESFEGKTISTPASSSQRSTHPVMEKETNEDQEQVSVGKEVNQPVHKAKKAAKHNCKRGSHFEITISAKVKYTVRIPVKFARSNDLSGVRQLLLIDPEGHPWPVNILHCNQLSEFGQAWLLLSAGWRDFRIGNELKDGDICIFKLEKKNEMLVQILRSCGDDSSRSKSPPLQQVGRPKQKGSPSMVTRTPKPADPTQFRSIIVPSNVCKNGYMNIPKAFRSSIDLSAKKEVVLVDPSS